MTDLLLEAAYEVAGLSPGRSPAWVTTDRAKSHLRQMGWSNRTAAPVLGVTYPHLSKVLNGHRESQRLLREIANLPPRKEVAHV